MEARLPTQRITNRTQHFWVSIKPESQHFLPCHRRFALVTSGSPKMTVPRDPLFSPTLPPRQEAVLIALAAHLASHGRSPTHREVAEKLGLHTGDVTPYLLPLVKKGFLATIGTERVGARRRWHLPTPLAEKYLKKREIDLLPQLQLGLGPVEVTPQTDAEKLMPFPEPAEQMALVLESSACSA